MSLNNQTPIKVTRTGTNADGNAILTIKEFETGDVLSIEHGGTGADTLEGLIAGIATAEIPDGSITPAKLDAQTRNLTSLSDIPDYLGQPGVLGGTRYIANSLSAGTKWVVYAAGSSYTDVGTTGASGLMTSADKTKLNNLPAITSLSDNITIPSGVLTVANAVAGTSAGLMTSADKTKLNNLPAITGLADNVTIPSGVLTVANAVAGTSAGLMTSADKTKLNGLQPIPSGGTAGQVLSKKSDSNFDMEWTTVVSGIALFALLNAVSIGVYDFPSSSSTNYHVGSSSTIRESIVPASTVPNYIGQVGHDANGDVYVAVSITGTTKWEAVDPSTVGTGSSIGTPGTAFGSIGGGDVIVSPTFSISPISFSASGSNVLSAVVTAAADPFSSSVMTVLVQTV